jgi:hypothetical protein
MNRFFKNTCLIEPQILYFDTFCEMFCICLFCETFHETDAKQAEIFREIAAHFAFCCFAYFAVSRNSNKHFHQNPDSSDWRHDHHHDHVKWFRDFLLEIFCIQEQITTKGFNKDLFTPLDGFMEIGVTGPLRELIWSSPKFDGDEVKIKWKFSNFMEFFAIDYELCLCNLASG